MTAKCFADDVIYLYSLESSLDAWSSVLKCFILIYTCSGEMLDVLLEADQSVLQTYPELKCGVLVQFRIEASGSSSNQSEEHAAFFVDLKSERVSVQRGLAASHSGMPADISVSIASEDIFRGLASKR